MARIRTIKPEFWSSEQIVECSPSARLSFVGLWNFCDDGGVHPASLRRLKMEVWPGDSITIDDLGQHIDELKNAGLLIEFEADVDGAPRRYWAVTGWARHQKVDRPTLKYPSPKDRRIVDEPSTNARRGLDEPSPPEGKGREGSLREGKKESRRAGVEDNPPHARVKRGPSACSPEGSPEDDSGAPPAGTAEADAQGDVKHAMRVLERVLETCGANGTYEGTVHDVLGWLGAGYDPDLDILPTVEAMAARRNFRPPKSNLKYFSAAIREAHERRTAAGGEAQRDEPVKPMTQAQRDEMHRNWCLLFDERGFWPETTFGPLPGRPGCEVPERIWRQFPRLVERLGLDAGPDDPSADGAPEAAAAAH